MHQFYAHPDFASRVWVNLRYCAAFRRRLAQSDVNKDLSAWQKWWQSSEEHVAAVSRGPPNFHPIPSRSTRCAAKHKMYPDPPTFLSDLIANENLTPDQRDKRIQELLADPKTVRDDCR